MTNVASNFTDIHEEQMNKTGHHHNSYSAGRIAGQHTRLSMQRACPAPRLAHTTTHTYARAHTHTHTQTHTQTHTHTRTHTHTPSHLLHACVHDRCLVLGVGIIPPAAAFVLHTPPAAMDFELQLSLGDMRLFVIGLDGFHHHVHRCGSGQSKQGAPNLSIVAAAFHLLLR